VIYLVIAYAFAAAMLGGFLAWSLRTLRDLERKPPGR
jgi:hypothetical protein